MDLLHQIDRDGFAIVDDVLRDGPVNQLIAAIDARKAEFPNGAVANMRNLSAVVGEIADLSLSDALIRLAEQVVGTGAIVVRSLLFDKNATSNWNVSWHQDLTIAVRAKREMPGYGPWSVKANIPHAQPPVCLLEKMITLRLHLDDCDADNGAVKVLPGSHREGRLSALRIQEWLDRIPPVTRAVRRGGVMLMRPLLLHGSARAVQPTHRRVVHLEFSAEKLPLGLEWYESGSEQIT